MSQVGQVQLVRHFKVGARLLPFPIPQGSLEDNCRQMAINYPAFRWTEVYEDDAVLQGDNSLVYELKLPPTKVNG